MRYLITPLLIILATAAIRAGQTDRDRNEALRHLRAGQEALEVEKFEEAEREFKTAIGLDPRLELAHHGLGRVYMATKRYVSAVDAFTSSRNVFQANIADALGQRLADHRNLDDQIRTLRDLRNGLQSGRVRTRNVASSLQRVDDEISQLETLRRRDPDRATPTPPYITVALGSAYFRTGAFADAEREWRLALAVDANIGEVHNNLAVVCMLTGRYDEAEREIQLAEKSGFRVSPAFKEELKAKKAGKG